MLVHNIYKKFKDWQLKRHVAKFGSKNNGYFNYFNKAWFEEHQETLIFLLNHWLLKYWFRWILRIHKDCKFSEYIDEIKPNTYRIKISENTFRSDFRTHQKFSKRIYYAFCPVWWAIHLLDWTIQKTVAPEFSFGFDTLTAYPDASPEVTCVDGRAGISSGQNTFTAYRDGNGTFAYDNGYEDIDAYLGAGTVEPYFNFLSRGFALFNTSSIGSTSIITGASLSLYPSMMAYQLEHSSLHIAGTTTTNNTSIVAGDFQLVERTSYASIAGASLSTNSYNVFTLNASGITNISKTSISKFSIQLGWDIDNSFGGVWWGANYYTLYRSYSADQTGTSQDPKLIVTYTLVTAISAIFGIPIADIKTINGIAGASIKSIMGLTYVQPPPPVYWYGERGVFGGGSNGANTNVIDYITISTIGNATDFGDLTSARDFLASCSNGSRGVWAGGNVAGGPIDYVTIATTGNAVSFGNLSDAFSYQGSCSNTTRGLFGGGYNGSYVKVNTIDYITIATTGNATDFGDLSSSRVGVIGCADMTRGIFGGGYISAAVNTIDYVTIATTSNTSAFGNLIPKHYQGAGFSSLTRGIFGGSYDSTEAACNTISYITIQTTGDSTDFGDLTVTRVRTGGCSNGTRGCFGGGFNSTCNVIDYITIATTGNATDFGDLIAVVERLSACSGN